jgi:hypothetical protein
VRAIRRSDMACREAPIVILTHWPRRPRLSWPRTRGQTSSCVSPSWRRTSCGPWITSPQRPGRGCNPTPIQDRIDDPSTPARDGEGYGTGRISSLRGCLRPGCICSAANFDPMSRPRDVSRETVILSVDPSHRRFLPAALRPAPKPC